MEEKTTKISCQKTVVIVSILLFGMAVWCFVEIFLTKMMKIAVHETPLLKVSGNEILLSKVALFGGSILYALLGICILKMINWVRIFTIVIFMLGLVQGIFEIIKQGFKLTDTWLILDIVIITLLLLKSTREAFRQTTLSKAD